MLRYEAFTRSEVPKYPHGDAAKYFLYAYNFKNFGIYGNPNMALLPADTDQAVAESAITPDAFLTPGYPLFLSMFLGGGYEKSQADAARFVQVLLSTLTILMAYATFAQLGRLYGLGIAALMALSPHLVNMNLFLLTEPLFCFLLVATVWLLSRVNKTSSPLLFLLIGIILAIASLTRPWLQGYLFVLLGYMAISKFRIRISNTLLIFVGAAIIAAPWILRNIQTVGTYTDPTLFLSSMHHGMYPDMMFEGREETLGYAYNADPKSPELGKSLGVNVEELRSRLNENPAEYLKWYLFGKTRTVLSWGIIAGADAVLVYQVRNSPYFELPAFYLSSYYMEKVHTILMVLSLFGVAIVWLPVNLQYRTNEEIFVLRAISLLILYFLFVHSVLAPYPRYSIPMRPILYAMSLYPMLLLVERVRRNYYKTVIANIRDDTGR